MLKHTAGGVAVALAMVFGVIGGGAVWATTEPPADPTTAPPSVDVSSAPTTAPASASSTAASTVPSTTVDPAVALDAAISESAVQAATAGRAALFQPGDPAVAATLDQWYVAGSPARARIDRLAQEQSGAARVLRPHPSIADAAIVEDVIPGAGASPTRAGVVVCLVEASEEVSPSGAVLAQEVTARREVFEMNLVDTQWQLLTSSNLQTWSSQAECTPPTPEITQAAEITVRIAEIDAVQVGVVVDPDDPDADSMLRSVLSETGDTLAGTREFIQRMAADGQALRIEPGRPHSVTIEAIAPLGEGSPTGVSATVCGIDPAVLYEPGAGPDGQDAIVDDFIYAYRSTWHLVMEDGSWQLDLVEILDQWTGVVECPPA